MTEKIRIYVDMDGTLARFHDEQMYLERMFEKGFFMRLKPFDNAVDAIKCIIDNPNVDVYVLSAAITTPYCIPEKNAWLDKYLPQIDKEHRIFVESRSTPKSLCVPGSYMYIDNNGKRRSKISENDFLIDDYNKNLEEWQHDGGTAIKAKNNINHKGLNGKLWDGLIVDINQPVLMIVNQLAQIFRLQRLNQLASELSETDEEMEI